MEGLAGKKSRIASVADREGASLWVSLVFHDVQGVLSFAGFAAKAVRGLIERH